MQIIPIKDLKNTVEIEKRCTESGEPVFITKNGYGRLVVMDIALYERTLKQMYEANLVNESLAEIDAGVSLLDGDTVKSEVMARYGK